MSERHPKAFPTNQPVSSSGEVAFVPIPRRLLLWLTSGVAGTVLFVVIYTIEGASRPGYNALRETISSLDTGPMGWLQQLNFALCGLSVLWLAFVWRQILQGGVCGALYPLIRGIEGVGLLAIAFFTQDPLHTLCLIVIVGAMSVDLLVIAWRCWHQPHWHDWAIFSLACGLLPMGVMPFFGVALSSYGALSGYAGILERLATNADTIWGVVILFPLWAGVGLMKPHT